jgi:Fe2+ transport system protein B
MLILSTIKEYTKIKGLSDTGVRKRVSQKLDKSVTIDNVMYIIHEDRTLEKLQNRLKNSNAKIRELKLKLDIKTDNKYLEEIEKQNQKYEKKVKKLEKQILRLHEKKDRIYENALGSLFNQISYKKSNL